MESWGYPWEFSRHGYLVRSVGKVLCCRWGSSSGPGASADVFVWDREGPRAISKMMKWVSIVFFLFAVELGSWVVCCTPIDPHHLCCCRMALGGAPCAVRALCEKSAVFHHR